MKKMTSIKKILSLLLCVVLIAVVALFATGCGAEKPEAPESTEAATVLNEKQFTFKVTDADGNESVFDIKTDKATVGEALMDEDLIQGEMGDYGLYVKTVNGITLDYDTDGKYWSFYVNGEYALTGVDTTEITDGAIYEFKAE